MRRKVYYRQEGILQVGRYNMDRILWDEYEGIEWIGGIGWIEIQDGKEGIRWRGWSRMVQDGIG